MCAGCRQMKEKRNLIRIVRTPDNEVLIDLTGKKPGRGVYLCLDLKCLELAEKSRRLEKNLHHPISKEIMETLREILKKALKEGILHDPQP
jgi:predicted RNA-binding protein YlxR (DUF448 family)